MKVCVRQDTTYNNFKIGPFQFQIEHLKKNKIKWVQNAIHTVSVHGINKNEQKLMKAERMWYVSKLTLYQIKPIKAVKDLKPSFSMDQIRFFCCSLFLNYQRENSPSQVSASCVPFFLSLLISVGLITRIASQNRAPPVRGEICWLNIDWGRHILWWLMLKRFLTKRICKRCVTHRVFPFLYSQWWASLDWNSQTIIFSLSTYWQDAGRGLNGGYPITAIKVKHINIHFSDMLIGSVSAKLYFLQESHKDQSNSYTDWSCLIEKTRLLKSGDKDE